jgi:hypothetical protein
MSTMATDSAAMIAVHRAPGAALSPVWLLALYGIVPASLLFYLWDLTLNDSTWTRALPEDPHSIQWFTLFFMLPHICSSTLTMLDGEYVRHYRKRLLVSIPLMLLVMAIFFQFLGVAAFSIFIAVYTIQHLVSQQTGIASMLARNKSKRHETWKWVQIVSVSVLYVAILTGNKLVHDVANAISIGAVPALVWLGLQVAREARTDKGRLYVHANTVMTCVFIFFFWVGQPFFMILIPRFVHDVSAFSFYVSHNANRNSEVKHNLVSKLTSFLRLPELIATPATGMIAALGLTVLLAGSPWMFPAMTFIALFHYYWESVIWKTGAPHRAYVRI